MKIRTLGTVAFAGLLLTSSVTLTGCSGTTKSGSKYDQTLDQNYTMHMPADLATTHQASIRAVRDDLGFTIESETMDALEGHIKGKTARGDRVEVETFKEGERLTRVDVFVGPMGDKAKSLELLNAIEKRLN